MICSINMVLEVPAFLQLFPLKNRWMVLSHIAKRFSCIDERSCLVKDPFYTTRLFYSFIYFSLNSYMSSTVCLKIRENDFQMLKTAPGQIQLLGASCFRCLSSSLSPLRNAFDQRLVYIAQGTSYCHQ